MFFPSAAALPARMSSAVTAFSMPGRDGFTGLPPAAMKTASAPASLTASGVAAVPRRISTPASASCASMVSMNSLSIPLFGGMAARLTVPPSLSEASKRMVLKPRLASVRAASMPAGPAPATATVRPAPLRTSFSSPYSNSRPRTGFRVQPSGSPSFRMRKHSMQPMHLRISCSLPAAALQPQSGSARCPRAMPTKSTSPASSISSAKAGCLILQTAMTGIFTTLRMFAARWRFQPSRK